MNKILFFIFFSGCFIAHSQSVDFTFQSSNGLYCNPSSIQFTQSATGNPTGYVWTFGNGTASNNPNPVVTFNNPGTYSVKLVAIYDQYALEVTKTVTINPSINASVSADRNYICKPGVINFTGISNGNIASYSWDFGDGSPIVNTPAGNTSHNFLNYGSYNITLTATDRSGCYATANSSVSVKVPAITGNLFPLSGCVVANVNFNANVAVPLNSSVTNYTWDFNDGSPVSSTPNGVNNHNYNAAGNYAPTLNITTSEGCTNNYSFTPIAFGTPPFNHIAYPVKAVICGSETATMVSKATNANKYEWDFGDGNTTVVGDTIAQHKYLLLGNKTITVIPSYNDCNGTPITFQINVVGVIAHFNYSNSCSDKKTFSFTNTSQGSLSTATWDFGDGTPVVNSLNAVHTFPSSGSFITTLTVTDNVTGCNDVYTKTIYTADPVLVNIDSSICKNTSTVFSIANTYNNPAVTYTWNVAGVQSGPFSQPTFTIVPTQTGNFNNFAVINNGAEYCRDTIRLTNTILVRGPDLDFTAPDTICFNSLYNVINNSKPFRPVDSIKIWYWNFGVTAANDSIYQPQPYTYNSTGRYNVKLIAIDKNGCKDSLVKAIVINPLPFLQVIPGLDTLCLGQAATLIAFHSDPILWSPTNFISCAACDTVIANPTTTTKFYVTATNSFNCNYRDSVLIKVYQPFVAIPEASDLYICLNDSVKLLIDPPMRKIMWSPATALSSANNYGPFAYPATTIKYTAMLSDSVGCFTSSADITVHVKSLPTVNAGPDKIYPFNAAYIFTPVYSNNVSVYAWTPASQLSCDNCAVPNGIALSTTTYLLNVTSDSGCVAKDTVTIFVDCKDAYILMPTVFTPNNDDLNDRYFPLTRGISYIIRFSIYNRNGKLVYEQKNFPPNNKAYGWNGKIQNMDQSTSVYVYYIEALCDIGQKLYRRGSVLLAK